MAVHFEAVCGPKYMAFWQDVGDPYWLSTHLPDSLYDISVQRYRPLNMPLSCKVVHKGDFGPPICRGKGYHRFWTCIFKSHLLSSMWPILVEFCSASSEIGGRKDKEEKRKKERIRGKI